MRIIIIAMFAAAALMGCDTGDTNITEVIDCIAFPPGHENCPCEDAARMGIDGGFCLPEEELQTGPERSGFVSN